MMFRTHLAFAFLIGILVISYFNVKNQILFILLVLIGALLPDIDSPTSKLGKYFKPVSFLFEHRGFLHSIFIIPLISILIYFLTKNYLISLPLITGYLSHLISDAITIQGIMPFRPFSKFRLNGFIETASLFEYIILIAIVTMDIFMLLRL